MKKLYILSLMLFVFNNVNSQNWMPINKSEKYNYCSGKNLYKTIWADSIKIINSDSVFFLNKVIKKVKDEPQKKPPHYAIAFYLENQSQFFLSQILYSTNRDIVMKENDSIKYFIKPFAKLHETWVFDSLKNNSAKVVAVSTMTILGKIDSIKIIQLSNNDTIVLSKNYGITKFPTFDATHQHMNLVGIEGRNIGLVIPKYKDFFNFNVGDVFCYRIDSYYSSRDNSTNYQKITVKGKIIKGDSIFYLNCFGSYETGREAGLYVTKYIKKDSIFLYIDTPNDFLNKYGDQITNLQTIGDTYKPVIVSSSKKIIDTIFALTKTYQISPLAKISGSDTIIDHGGLFPPHGLDKESSSIFGTNLGLINYYSERYSGWNNSTRRTALIGCIKNGIVHGTILADSLFKSKSEVSIEDSIFNVYPNPANFEITIEYFENNKEGILSILNINAQELKRQQIRNRKTQIDISNLKSGEYFIKMITDKTVKVRKIIKE